MGRVERWCQIPEAWLGALARRADLRARHFAVALAILGALRRWPQPVEELSARYLAKATGRSRRLVRSTLEELVELGILERVAGSGTRPPRWSFRDPASWSAALERASGRPPAPTRESAPPRPLLGTPARPLVGTPSRHKVREREERESLPLEGPGDELPSEIRLELDATFALYPHPRTGIIRRARIGADRFAELVVTAGSRAAAVCLLLDAIHGFVVRKGLSPHGSGWDPWEHFELSSIASPAKLDANVAAAAAARELGHLPPFRRGDDARRPPRLRLAKPIDDREERVLRETVERERAELSEAELLERQRADVEALPESPFKRERMRRVRLRQRELASRAGSPE